MRKNLFGIIYAGEENMNLHELTSKRSVGSMPVGGRYRLIDFLLSNMVNSGLRNISVVPRKNYHSLMDHLGSGKDWDLSRKVGGLFIIPPYDNQDAAPGPSIGMLDTLKSASSFMRNVPQEYCILSGSHCLYNATYNDMADFHVENDADITILYNKTSDSKEIASSVDLSLSLDTYGRVVDAKPCTTGMAECNLSMDTYIIKKELLVYLINESLTRGMVEFNVNFFTNYIPKLKIYGYEHSGYVGRVSSVASYFKLNMDFLTTNVQKDLFHSKYNVITKIKDSAPTKYGDSACVVNSLIGSGCQIDGTVENCVLFRNVKVAKGVVLKNSIVMQSSEIYQNSHISNAILDKLVTVRPSSTLMGSPEYPVVIPKGANV